MSRPRAGYIGFNRDPAAGAESAPGVWTLREAEAARRAGTWPDLQDPYFSNVSLLLHMDGTGSTFTDTSGTPKTISALGNATQSTAQSKWGGKSLYLDGTSGTYLSVAASSSLAMSGDFVIEAWLYPLSASSNAMPIYEMRTSASNTSGLALLRYPNANTLNVYSNGFLGSSSSSLTPNQWQHVALVRSGSTVTYYIGGQSAGSLTNSSNFNNYTGGAKIGGSTSSGEVWVGYIDDFRLTVGSTRGYTGSTITVPTAAFPDA